jgi:hypothetical protein
LEIKGFSPSQPRFWESTRCIVLQDVSEAIPKIIQRELRVRCADGRSGAGFATLEKWLNQNDALFLRRNNAEPIVVLPSRTWAACLQKFPQGNAPAIRPMPNRPQHAGKHSR